MAEEVKEQPEVKEEAPAENADLGAAVGPGEDFDEPTDTMDDAEKDRVLSEARAAEADPTKGMSPSEQRDYWMKRANHFESEYKVEKVKRQGYDKRYGGLNQQGLKDATAPRVSDYALEKIGVPENVKDLESYTQFVIDKAKKEFGREVSEKQLDGKVEESEKRAREEHKGDDGLPAYDDLIDEVVAPAIRKNPKIFELIRLMEDPAGAAYTLGFILKYQNFQDIIKSQSREELVRNINNTAKQAATVRGKTNGRQPSGKLTAAEIEAMSPEDFEKELERFRSGA
jgi:hypothetical protein